MPLTVDQLYEEAVLLPGEAQADLVERLVAHIETHVDREIESAHLDVIRRRRDEIRAGLVQPVQGDAALARVRQMVK